MSFEFVNCPELPYEIAFDLIRLNEERQNPEISSQVSKKVYEVLLRTFLREHVSKLEKYEKPLSSGARVKIDEIDCILISSYTYFENMLYLSIPTVGYFDTLYKVAQEGTKHIFTRRNENKKIWFHHVNLDKVWSAPGD